MPNYDTTVFLEASKEVVMKDGSGPNTTEHTWIQNFQEKRPVESVACKPLCQYRSWSERKTTTSPSKDEAQTFHWSYSDSPMQPPHVREITVVSTTTHKRNDSLKEIPSMSYSTPFNNQLKFRLSHIRDVRQYRRLEASSRD